MPDAIGIGCNFLEAAATRDAVGLVLHDRAGRLGLRELVTLLDQKPRFVLVILGAVAAHEHPAAAQLLAIQLELQPPFLVVGNGIALGYPYAPVPQQNGARSVLLGR